MTAESAPDARTAPRPGAAGRAVGIALSLAVSAAGLWYAFHGIEWGGFARAVLGARWGWVAAGAGLAVATYLVRAWRWRYLFGRTRPGFLDCLVATLLGFFFLGVLPLRIGEVLKPWVLSRRSGVPFFRSFATVATERILDAVTILVLLLVSALLLPGDVPVGRALGIEIGGVNVAAAFAAAMGLVLAGVAAVVFAEPLVARLVGRLLVPFPRLRAAVLDRLEHFVGGLRAVGETPGGLAAALAGSIVLWIAMGASFWLALRGFSDSAGDVGARAGLVGAVFTQTVVALAVAAPAAPGFVGTFQAGCVFALELLGVEKDAALAFSVVFHVAHFAPTLAIGAALLPLAGLRLADVRRAAEAPETPAA